MVDVCRKYYEIILNVANFGNLFDSKLNPRYLTCSK